MATHHWDAGHLVHSDINLNTDNAEGINTGLANDNESTSGSDTTVALGWPEQKVTPINLYPATRPSWWPSQGK